MKTRLLLVLCALASLCSAQVVISTPPKFQSFLQDGTPNAFGCVRTYQSGTTTPLASYTDYTQGTENQNPVPLDAGGQANIWLLSGQLYTIVVKTSGGTNCSSGQTISTTNGMNQSILNLNNTWNGTQTFLSQIFLNPSDLQIVFGAPAGTRTTLDIPPTTGDLILHGPPLTGNDTLLSQNATQTVTNKNFTSGTQINGCGITNGPGTYVCIANNGGTATVLNKLAILTGTPLTALVAPTSVTAGVVGVVTGGAGITGSATIQQSGQSFCVFDGATFAGDAVIASATVAGDCHDEGVIHAGGVGTVLSSNGSGGTYGLMLSSPPDVIARDSLNLGSSAISSGVCDTVTITEAGVTPGNTVAWAYVGGSPTASDLKLVVSPESKTNQVTWNVCNPTAGTLTQSGSAVVNFTVLP